MQHSRFDEPQCHTKTIMSETPKRQNPKRKDATSDKPLSSQPSPALNPGTAESPANIETLIVSNESSVSPGSSSGETTPALQVLGRYKIVRELGSGGMGAVYLAEDSLLNRKVALKIPQLDSQNGQQALARFQREAQIAAQLGHPNICQVYEFKMIDGRWVMAMEYVEGCTLAMFTRPSTLLKTRDAVLLVKKIALAMEAAHQKGLIHRDLKPFNIMLPQTESGRKALEPKIMDFGLAKRMGNNEIQLTLSGDIMGTPPYMSKEQWLNKPDDVGPKADVYSLGVILYELLSGKLPYEFDKDSPPTTWFYKLVTDPQIPIMDRVTNIDPELSKIVMHAIDKEANDRYESMSALANDLDAWLKKTSKRSSQALTTKLVVPKPSKAVSTHEIETRGNSTKIIPPSKSRLWRLPIYLAGPLLIIFATIELPSFFVSPGVIAIESEVDGIEVVVSHQGREVATIDQRNNMQVRLKPGDYSFTLKSQRNDVQLERNQITLPAGGRETTRVVRVQNATPVRRNTRSAKP